MAVAISTEEAVPPEPRRLRAVLRRCPRIAAAVALVIGTLALLGWAANIHAITHVVPDLPMMIANTAVMCILTGLSLWLHPRAHRAPVACIISRVAAGGAVLLAIATLGEYAVGVDLSIDQLITSRRVGRWPAGRPAPHTAAAFACIGVALLVLDRGPVRRRHLSDVLAMLAGAIAVVAFAGYLIGVPAMYGRETVPYYVGMSLPTSLVVLSLSLGILTVHLDRGILAIVIARDAGGIVARQLLVGMAALPPFAIAVIVGARLAWYSFPVAFAFVLCFALAVTSVLTFATATRLSQFDAEQRASSNELRASEARLRTIVDGAQDGIFLADLDGRYIDVNPAACAMLGYERDELIGLTIADVVQPAEVPRLEREREIVTTGGTARGEWQLRRKDGSSLDAEVVASVLSDGRWQAIARDITERKRNARRLQAIVDQFPEGVAVIDEHEQITAINRAFKAWAFDPSVPDRDAWVNPGLFDVRDLEGKLVPPDEFPIARAIRTGVATPDEGFQFRQPDGRMVPIETRAAPIRDETGRVIGAVVVGRDVSERREFERLREEWVAIVAHELRQPVAAIMSASGILHENLAPGREPEILEGLREAAMRMNRMVEDLLDAARIAANRLRVERTDVDVVDTVARAIEQARLAHPDVQLVLDAPASQLARIDRVRIEQVLDNLLSNAIKYRTPDTTVRVQVRRTGDWVRIGVLNEGTPIDPEEVPKLFARFSRTHDARASGLGGVGLGLYVCKGLVEAHGGRIWIDSRAGWTSVYFTVLASEASAVSAA
jgi:PAS domain S-box-containing protein